MNVIARPARRITCQRDGPWRKTTRPCPDLGDRQCQSAAQRLGCDRTVPLSPCAERNLRSLELARRASGRDRPSARLSANHRAGRLARLTASGL